jgi:hypothetical protein
MFMLKGVINKKLFFIKFLKFIKFKKFNKNT